MNDTVWLALCLALATTVVVLTLRLRSLSRKSEEASSGLVSLVGRSAHGGRRAEEVLARMGEGILLLGRDLRPVFCNPAAGAMLGLRGSVLPPRLPSEDILAASRRALDEGGVEEIVRLRFPLPVDLRVEATRLEHSDGVVVVLRDVTEELRAQSVRREFVAHASHELKSPVAGLHALAEAIQGAVRDDPGAAARFSGRLVSESTRLNRLITDLLDLSRVEDPANLSKEPAKLSNVAGAEGEAAALEAGAQNIELIRSIEPDLWVRGDEQQLALMIRNLLDNAIRYTPDGGTVTMTVVRDGGDAVVTVTDTGIGIPLDAQGRVFERFYRVDKARSRDRGGTGLGLAIVKHVAELHGGGVRVQSELRKGSTFIASIPAMREETTEAPVERVAG